MAAAFDTCRVQPESSTPQLTSFVGVGDTENGIVSVASKDECTKIMIALNHEVARYCTLAVALGTTVDSEYLRQQLRQTRTRAWDQAKSVKRKLIPMIRKKKTKTEAGDDLESLYRVFSASLEYLESLLFKTMLLQADFLLHSDSAMSETLVTTKKTPDPPGDLSTTSDSDPSRREVDDITCLQREVSDLQEMVYDMNQRIAIQPWEVEPEIDIDRFTTDHDGERKDNSGSRESSVVEFAPTIGNEDQRRIRCVFVVVLTVILVLVGSIVGILLGVLD